jgi:transcriptional regulator of acetoin/glycerol metabolism
LCRDGIIRLSNLPQEILDTGTRAPPPAVAVAAAAPASAPAGGGNGVAAGESSPSAALREAECAALLRELERMRWNISRTAQTLGISRNTLYRKIHKHRILLEH